MNMGSRALTVKLHTVTLKAEYQLVTAKYYFQHNDFASLFTISNPHLIYEQQ